MRALIIDMSERWKAILLSGLIGLIVLGGGWYYLRAANHFISAEELLDQALNQAYAAQSYRYKLVSELNVNGQAQTLSEVLGEKADAQTLHLTGTMVNTPIELYQAGDTAYNKDPFTNRWYTVSGYDLTRQEILLMEVNPLANFNFKEIVEINNLGREKVGSDSCWVLACTADLENPLLEALWQDFRFQFWIDRDDHLLRKGQLTACSKSNPETKLTITAEFYDYNQPIQLAVPKV
jgi:hypothetical protein